MCVHTQDWEVAKSTLESRASAPPVVSSIHNCVLQKEADRVGDRVTRPGDRAESNMQDPSRASDQNRGAGQRTKRALQLLTLVGLDL
jgi:hypothetical protein